MKCTECGADNADASRVCGVCNAPLSDKDPNAIKLNGPDSETRTGEMAQAPLGPGRFLFGPPEGVSVRRSGRGGRGVFADKPFPKGAVIERCPVIVIPADQLNLMYETNLSNYIYPWIDQVEEAVMVLGFGSIYNHSYTPNADWVQDFVESIQSYVALRDIRVGEEITVNYNGPIDDQSPLWFDVAD